MPEQLAYVIITPYSLNKSRTGGILSRLLSRTGLELAAARLRSRRLCRWRRSIRGRCDHGAVGGRVQRDREEPQRPESAHYLQLHSLTSWTGAGRPKSRAVR